MKKSKQTGIEQKQRKQKEIISIEIKLKKIIKKQIKKYVKLKKINICRTNK